ncbi:hybrid sensor histidine kinase/response regulator, partial [candidate division KSB1 bacterium]|nr:hybrid sensor histidine kinase/response regulator [candidate division KSB1 bacterium]
NDYLFWIKDNGIGINKEKHEVIFGLFGKVNPEENNGTGIGLAITRKILEHHGGKIWLESEPGEGSTFFFTLPKKSNRRALY